MSAENSQETRKKAFAERREGFALVEAIIAIIILTLSIFASFQTIAYALSITTEVRGRRERYEQLENIGLADAAAGEADGEADIVRTPATLTSRIFMGGAQVEADNTAMTPALTGHVYKHPNQTGKMKSPVFVIFLKQEA